MTSQQKIRRRTVLGLIASTTLAGCSDDDEGLFDGVENSSDGGGEEPQDPATKSPANVAETAAAVAFAGDRKRYEELIHPESGIDIDEEMEELSKLDDQDVTFQVENSETVETGIASSYLLENGFNPPSTVTKTVDTLATTEQVAHVRVVLSVEGPGGSTLGEMDVLTATDGGRWLMLGILSDE